MPINFKLKAIYIVDQWKAFWRNILQKIPKFSCVRKENVGILVTSRNDNRKIIQLIRIMNVPHTRIRKWSQFTQFR